MERGKGPHMSAQGAVSIHLGCLVPPLGVDTTNCLDGYLHVSCVFWDSTVEVMEIKFTLHLEL